MKTLNLIQGDANWHAHRATSKNASDAPAMLGCSEYKTRSELLHEAFTGIRPEVAQTLVHLEADLGDIITRGTLQSGIRYALGRRDLGA